jgi:hypothetical protein
VSGSRTLFWARAPRVYLRRRAAGLSFRDNVIHIKTVPPYIQYKSSIISEVTVPRTVPPSAGLDSGRTAARREDSRGGVGGGGRGPSRERWGTPPPFYSKSAPETQLI